MSSKLVTIITNQEQKSLEVKEAVTKKLLKSGYNVTNEFSDESELIICIGGDGSVLRTVHACDFPATPIVGINTGHLGFFQEIRPEEVDMFIDLYESGNYSIQDLSTVECTVTTQEGKEFKHRGLNEVAISGRRLYTVHLNITIDGQLIERFSGDGIVVSTPAGSTAYNYSLGGAIVDPRLDLLQVTPAAPMNTSAYRAFTSPLLLPADIILSIEPVGEENTIFLSNDGIRNGYTNVKKIDLEISDDVINLIRFENYNFWNKVTDKLLDIR